MSTSMQHASGTLLNASPPSMRAMLIDGPVEQVRRLAAERQRLDAAERVVGLEDRVVAEPRRRAVRGGPDDLDADREHALRLDADVQVGRLAGQREVAAQALGDERVGRAVVDVLGLLVGHADELHAHLVLLGRVADRAHHRRERALHVVGAAADQAVALDARLELALARGHDVEVAVEDRRSARRVAPTSAITTGRPSKSRSTTSISRASSQPLTNAAAARSASGFEVSYLIRRSARTRSSMLQRIGSVRERAHRALRGHRATRAI